MSNIERVTAKTEVYRLAVDDENGKELGVIAVNVMDPNLVSRIQKGYRNIQDIIKKGERELTALDKGESTEEPDLMDNAEYYEKITEVDAELKAEMDRMFNANISDVFGETNMLTPTSNGYFVFNILDAVIPALKEEMEKRTKEREKAYQNFKMRH